MNTPEPISLRVRVYVDGKVEADELVTAPAAQMDGFLPQLGEKHAALFADRPHMIEFEFIDEPDPLKRFFRFGTDPGQMVTPIQVASAPELSSIARKIFGKE